MSAGRTAPGRIVGMVPLPEEEIVSLRADGRLVCRMSCTPRHLEELAVGWLYAQRFIDAGQDVEACTIDETGTVLDVRLTPAARARALPPPPSFVAGSAGGSFDRSPLDDLAPLERGYALDLEKLKSAMNALLEQELMYRAHGGVHGAMLAASGSYRAAVVMEDIGRNNAIDKAIGRGLLDGLDLPDHLIFVTGRISSEMVLKAFRAGIAVVVSLTTMTSKALEIARATNQTLVAHVHKPRPILVNF